MHQATQGSAERAGASLRTVETGHRPPEIEVIRTPATGVTITHRVGIHLDPAASAGAGATPRAVAEPAVDAYLAGLLPPLGTVGCRVHWNDPVDGSDEVATVSPSPTSAWPPDDVVELLRSGEQAMDELDDRDRSARAGDGVAPPGRALARSPTARPTPGQIPIFDIAAQCAHLRSIVDDGAAAAPDRRRARRRGLRRPRRRRRRRPGAAGRRCTRCSPALLTDAEAYLAVWQPAARRPRRPTAPTILDETDDAVDDAIALLERGARLAVPGSGWGQAIASRGAQFARTIARVA